MTEIVARKYTVEIHDPADSDALVTILENAHKIAYTEAVNEAPTLKFDLPADDGKAANITKANEIWLRNYSTGALIERFRLAKETDKRARTLVTSISAEGLLNQLADEFVSDFEADTLTVTQIVDALLLLQILTPKITRGTINPGVSRSIKASGDTILKIIRKLRETVGGYVYLDTSRALQWRTTIGKDKGQQIRYRKNLKGITRDIDYTTLANRLYAYGIGEGEARIKLSDIDGREVDYIEDTTSQEDPPTGWGGIYVKQIVDKSITSPNTLLAWAEIELEKSKNPRISYKVDAVDLSESIDIDFSFEKLELGSTIKVIDEDLGIDVSAKILKITHPDLLHPERMQLEIANRVKDITDALTVIAEAQHPAIRIGVGDVLIEGTITVRNLFTEGETTIDGSQITTGTIVLGALDFVPLSSSGATGEVIATINATEEGIRISADKIDIAAGRSIFKQAGIPTSLSVGDLWFDTDDSNRLYRAAAIDADEITEGEWELVRDAGIAGALAAAATALEVADGQIIGFYQDAEPGEGMAFGDIWIDTDGADPPDSSCIYRYEDENGRSIAELAWREAATNAVGLVYLDAYGAQATADGKIVTFYQAGIPTSEGIGDLWIDTDDEKKLYRAESIGANAIEEGEWVLARDEGVATALADAATALEVADGQIVGFYQDAEPGEGMSFGDIWIDTDGHTPPNTSDIYRYEDEAGGSQDVLAWRAAATNAIGIVFLNAYGAQATADGKIEVFYQDASPIPTGNLGDLWINTADGEKLYRAMSNGSDQITAGEWEEVQDADIATNASAIIVEKNRITAVVTDVSTLDGEVNTNTGNITVNANAITAEVTNRTNADSTLSGQISVNATAIALRLLESDFTGTNIVAEINLTGSGVRITGDSITLDGDVNCLSSFEVQGKVKVGETLEVLGEVTAGAGNVTLGASGILISAGGYLRVEASDWGGSQHLGDWTGSIAAGGGQAYTYQSTTYLPKGRIISVSIIARLFSAGDRTAPCSISAYCKDSNANTVSAAEQSILEWGHTSGVQSRFQVFHTGPVAGGAVPSVTSYVYNRGSSSEPFVLEAYRRAIWM